MFTYFLKFCFSFQLDLDKGHNVVNFVAAYFSSFFFSTSSKDSSSFKSNSQRSVLIKDFVVRGKIYVQTAINFPRAGFVSFVMFKSKSGVKTSGIMSFGKQMNNSQTVQQKQEYQRHRQYTFNGNESGE